MKSKIKQTRRKVALIAAAALMTLPVYARANENPIIHQETREAVEQVRSQEIISRTSEVEEALKKARDYLNRASVSDSYLSVAEQDTLLSKYAKADSLADRVVLEARKEEITELEKYKLQELDRKLYNGFNSNLHRFDQGKPDVQEILEKEGLNVGVEKTDSTLEAITYAGSVCCAFFAGFGFFIYGLDKLSKKV